MKRIFIIVAMALIFVGAIYRGLFDFGDEALIFECEAGTYDAEDEMFYSDKTGAELCNFKQVEEAVTSGSMDADTYQMTFFGKIVHILVVYIGPIVFAIIVGYIVI